MASTKRLDYIDTDGTLRVHRSAVPAQCNRKIDTVLGTRMAWGQVYECGEASTWGEARDVYDLRPMDDPKTIN